MGDDTNRDSRKSMDPSERSNLLVRASIAHSRRVDE
jgi:hypothetical protein